MTVILVKGLLLGFAAAAVAVVLTFVALLVAVLLMTRRLGHGIGVDPRTYFTHVSLPAAAIALVVVALITILRLRR